MKKDVYKRQGLVTALPHTHEHEKDGYCVNCYANSFSANTVESVAGLTEVYGNTVDFLWNTYGKCHTDDRKNQKQNS